MDNLVLASASPRRLQLLNQVGLLPRILIAGIVEAPKPEEGPLEFAARAAAEKLEAVCKKLKLSHQKGEGDVVIAADTVVWFERAIFGKPTDKADAYRMVKSLSGRSHYVTTAYSIEHTGKALRSISRTVTTEVRFRDLLEQEIADYLETGEPFDKAGAYGVQGIGAAFVSHLNGSYTNVVGLPLSHVLEDLYAMGALDRLPMVSHANNLVVHCR